MPPEAQAPQPESVNPMPASEPAAAPMASAPEPPESHPQPVSGTYRSNPFELVKPSWQGFKLNWKPYLGLILVSVAAVVAVVVLVFLTYVMSRSTGATVIVGLIAFFGLVAASAVYLTPAAYRLQLAMARGHKLSLGQAVAGSLPLGLRLLGTGLLAGLAVLGGFLLLVVPGLIFLVWFSQSAYVVVNEDLSGVAALKRSRQLVRNRFWDVAGTLCLLEAPGVLSIIPVIGPLLSAGLAVVLIPAMAIRYEQLVALKQTSDGSQISTSPANFGAIGLALIAFSLRAQSNGADFKRLQTLSTPTPVVQTSDPYYSR